MCSGLAEGAGSLRLARGAQRQGGPLLQTSEGDSVAAVGGNVSVGVVLCEASAMAVTPPPTTATVTTQNHGLAKTEWLSSAGAPPPSEPPAWLRSTVVVFGALGFPTSNATLSWSSRTCA